MLRILAISGLCCWNIVDAYADTGTAVNEEVIWTRTTDPGLLSALIAHVEMPTSASWFFLVIMIILCALAAVLIVRSAARERLAEGYHAADYRIVEDIIEGADD